MSAKEKKNNDISTLIKRYQRISVVSEIENNLLSVSRLKVNIDNLFLCPLFDKNNYDLSCYENLKDSLKGDGFLVPLVVVEDAAHRYEIINGVKRYLLGKEIGLKEMPIVKADLNQERMFSYILENIQYEDDSPYVKTHAFKVLKETYHYSDVEIADLAGISISQVKNLLRLEKLPEFLKRSLISFDLTYSEARSLLNLPLEVQEKLYNDIQNGLTNVRDLEKAKRHYEGLKRKTTVTLKGKTVVIRFESQEEAQKNFLKISRDYKD